MDPTSISRTSDFTFDSRIPARTVVGITGHRKSPDVPGLTKGVTSAIEHIRQMSPSLAKTPIGLTVLTPLAEGADQLVAREVLKVPGSNLEVILPMDKDHYLEDFPTEQSKKGFEELLAVATSVRQQPFRGNRAESYEQIGRYVVDQCDVLIAIWDGKRAEGRGGTADVVRYARENRCPLLWINTADSGKLTIEPGRGLDAKAYKDLDGYNSEHVDVRELTDTPTLLSPNEAVR